MKCLNIALGSLVYTSSLLLGTAAHAEDCASVAQATPKNIYQCQIDDAIKIKLVADWIVDPVIQKTEAFDGLVQNVGYFSDGSVLNPALTKLLKQSDLSDDKKAFVVANAVNIDGKLIPEIKKYIETEALNRGCAKLGDAALKNYQYLDKKSPELASALSYTIQYCSWSSPNFTTATEIVSNGYPAGVLPLMDRLAVFKTEIDAAPDTDCSTNHSGRYWVDAYQNAVVSSLHALGEFRVERAESLVNSFFSVKCSAMANAAKSASAKITTGKNLHLIRKANADAIAWGMDMIRDHDSAYESTQNEVLDAFAFLLKNNSAQKSNIKAFLGEEYQTGYHSGNLKFNKRLHDMSL